MKTLPEQYKALIVSLKINIPKNTIEQIQSIFSTGISQINGLLSPIGICLRTSDEEILTQLTTYTSLSEVIEWEKKNPSWWRVFLIIMDPQRKDHIFWSWSLKEQFLNSIPDTYPANKTELLIKLYCEHYAYFCTQDKFVPFSKILDILTHKNKNNSKWFSKISSEGIPFSDENICSKIGIKIVQRIELPDEYFHYNHFPEDSKAWGFFEEYFLLTIEASINYRNSEKREEYKDWLFRQATMSTSSHRRTLAIAEFILEYVTNCYAGELKYILMLLKAEKTIAYYTLQTVGFTEARRKRIDEANYKIESFLNYITFETFFSSFDFDKDRKDYWKQNLYRFSIVRVFLPHKKFIELSENSINSNRLGRIESNSSPAVLIMQTTNYVIIEFGDTGNALYVYHKSDSHYKEATVCLSITKHDSLKNTSIQLLNRFRHSGRLIHKNGWENDMDNWFQNPHFYGG